MNTDRDTILVAASNGNAQALEFLRVFARRAHWVDDLADGDRSDRDGKFAVYRLAEMEAEWLICVSSNPFFLAHRAQLVPAMVLALNAWVDSDAHMGRVRDVVKGQWHEVVWLVAWLTGGWNKLRDTSSKFRAYDFEPASSKKSNGDPHGLQAAARLVALDEQTKRERQHRPIGQTCAGCTLVFPGPFNVCREDPLGTLCPGCQNMEIARCAQKGKEANGLSR